MAAQTQTVLSNVSPELMEQVFQLAPPPVDVDFHTVVQLDSLIARREELPEMWDVTKERILTSPFNGVMEARKWLEPTDGSRHQAVLAFGLESAQPAHLKLPHSMMIPVEWQREENPVEGMIMFYLTRISKKRMMTLLG